MPFPVAILAAGRGNRLSPLTDDRPKCLLPVGESSPLSLALDAIERIASVSEVLIVVGHARAKIEAFVAERGARLPIRLVDNPRFDTANNIYSAGLLRPSCEAGFLLVNSDVVCHPGVFRVAAAEQSPSLLVVDPRRPPRDEAMKVRFVGGRLVEIAKTLAPATADGEYIGITRFDGPGASAFFDSIETILANGGSDEWYEAAIGLAARRVRFTRMSIGELPWIEIDDPSDLQRAQTEILPKILGS
jgi:choline kinase